MTMTTTLTTRCLSGFDDPCFGRDEWNRLLRESRIDSAYLTWEFQRAWWDTPRPDQALLLVAAERDGSVIAVAPFYVDSDVVYLIGTDFEYDGLGFLGSNEVLNDVDVLAALLATAAEAVVELEGFELLRARGQTVGGGHGGGLRARRPRLLCR